MRRYLAFDARDEARLRTLAGPLDAHIDPIVDRFYERLLADPGTRAVFTGGQQQVERLRKKLSDWLRSLFTGPYDAAYIRQRVEIGRTHVRVGLPQRFVFAAMEVLRQELRQAVRSAGVRQAAAKVRALEKLLAIETALLVESYQGTFVEQVRASERSAVQERLTQAEHLARIGQLAASLAHEIKNPLAGISGAIQVIRDARPPDDPHRPILAEILWQINRLDRTVKDLLVYARPLPPRFEACQLNRVVERLMSMLQRQPALQRVRLEQRTDHRPLPAIEADESQLEQLLTNLVLNAADASDDGGLVTVTTRPTAGGVRLEVHDYGHGMDEETCRRALEPFFTTKSRGTGLGLPICQRIVDAHHGTLSIRSIVGKETVVLVELPLRQPPANGGAL